MPEHPLRIWLQAPEKLDFPGARAQKLLELNASGPPLDGARSKCINAPPPVISNHLTPLFTAKAFVHLLVITIIGQWRSGFTWAGPAVVGSILPS